jgi:hypothetical protein
MPGDARQKLYQTQTEAQTQHRRGGDMKTLRNMLKLVQIRDGARASARFNVDGRATSEISEPLSPSKSKRRERRAPFAPTVWRSILRFSTVWVLLVLVALAVQAAAPNATPLGAIAQQLHGPARVAADAAGNIYVTDPSAGGVVVFDSFGQQRAVHDGFAGPLAIAIADDGRIYLSEEKSGSVSVFDAQWNRLYQLGAGQNEFQLPSHLAVARLRPTRFMFPIDRQIWFEFTRAERQPGSLEEAAQATASLISPPAFPSAPTARWWLWIKTTTAWKCSRMAGSRGNFRWVLAGCSAGRPAARRRCSWTTPAARLSPTRCRER